MTDVIVKNLSIARKPRSIKHCVECAEPCYPGLPRYRVQHYVGGSDTENFLHLQCVTKWFTNLLRSHRDMIKKEGIK